MKRRELLTGSAALATAALAAAALAATAAAPAPHRPNVVLILTDDQGWGDVGFHGNARIRTPHMDRMAREGAAFTDFHVSPVCSPTRASLLTGRYNYRTGVVDTFIGRSLMHPDELTLAEMLRGAGYTTGIFGKWHLGDNYPLRAIDQGFDRAVVIKGGGLGQPSDSPGGGSYFDPILMRDGKAERFRGYCSDIYTDEALRFIETNRARPFFAYLATNAPHTPLEIADSYVEPYRRAGLDETTARIYGMVTNMDENVGRVLAKLQELGLARDTIVVFLTDNGPQQGGRFNGGMRGTKGTVFEGGIRVPFFLRWPAAVTAGTTIDRLAAHIDLTPTLIEACGVAPPPGHYVDGQSLLPLLRGGGDAWPDRTLFFQWHRGDAPEPFRACAARTQRWKLVDGKELYDLERDPGESRDLARENPEVVARLRTEYESWFRDVSGTRGFAPPRIRLGTPHEDPVVLTRQDWRGPRAGWAADSLGHWEVEVVESARYEVTLRMAAAQGAGEARFRLNGASLAAPIAKGATTCALGAASIPAGPGRLEAEVAVGDSTVGVHYVEIAQSSPLR
jgi:arylsulfatase A-like enzyme